MDSLVDSVFPNPIAAIDGIKKYDHFLLYQIADMPVHQFCRKADASGVTALKPSSNIFACSG